jgi:hypothetical protein
MAGGWAFGWSELFGAFQAAATFGGLGVAWWGVNQWRREQVGKRKAELAEEALALVYQAQEVFDFVRSPLSYKGEGASRQQSSVESAQEKERRDAEFVPFERLNSYKEFFIDVQRIRPRLEAYYGKLGFDPLHRILELRTELMLAIEELSDLGDDFHHLQGDDLVRHQTRRKELRSVKWKTSSGTDAFDEQLRKLKLDADAVFKPALEIRSRV